MIHVKTKGQGEFRPGYQESAMTRHDTLVGPYTELTIVFWRQQKMRFLNQAGEKHGQCHFWIMQTSHIQYGLPRIPLQWYTSNWCQYFCHRLINLVSLCPFKASQDCKTSSKCINFQADIQWHRMVDEQGAIFRDHLLSYKPLFTCLGEFCRSKKRSCARGKVVWRPSNAPQ